MYYHSTKMSFGNYNNRSNNRSYNNGNQQLIDVWNHTKEYFNVKKRPIPPSTKMNIYSLEEIPDNKDIVDTHTIEVMNEDSFNLAINYVGQGLKPLVLNMASDYKPGGGVASGKTAQEEELFRRSNAHLTHLSAWYPLYEHEIIYSPEVTIIKDTRNNNYELIDEVKVAMVACAAIRNPKLVKNQYSSHDYQLMSDKIESLFMLGIKYKHDALVLGALGCGAFNNPPTEIAKIFSTMVNKYGKYFKKIGFAILVVKSTDTDNLVSFRNILSK